jgi:hypothetical protein
MSEGQPKMIFLGFGKWARGDKIFALEPIRGDERGGGRRTRVWVEGIPEPILASRTERTILVDIGHRDLRTPVLDQALDLAERVAAESDKAGTFVKRSIKAEAGIDLDDLSRRARRVLEATSRPAAPPPENESLFADSQPEE